MRLVGRHPSALHWWGHHRFIYSCIHKSFFLGICKQITNVHNQRKLQVANTSILNIWEYVYRQRIYSYNILLYAQPCISNVCLGATLVTLGAINSHITLKRIFVNKSKQVVGVDGGCSGLQISCMSMSFQLFLWIQMGFIWREMALDGSFNADVCGPLGYKVIYLYLSMWFSRCLWGPGIVNFLLWDPVWSSLEHLKQVRGWSLACWERWRHVLWFWQLCCYQASRRVSLCFNRFYNSSHISYLFSDTMVHLIILLL